MTKHFHEKICYTFNQNHTTSLEKFFHYQIQQISYSSRSVPMGLATNEHIHYIYEKPTLSVFLEHSAIRHWLLVLSVSCSWQVLCCCPTTVQYFPSYLLILTCIKSHSHAHAQKWSDACNLSSKRSLTHSLS